jgi:hypothetical protein
VRGAQGKASTGATRDRLLVVVAALLAANVGITLVSVLRPAPAQADSPAVAVVPTAAMESTQGVAPVTTVEMLGKISNQLEGIGQRLAGIERRLDGELKARVTGMPSEK